MELTDLQTRQVISKVITDSLGNYLLTLPTGRDYAFTVNQKGFLFNSDQYFLKTGTVDSAVVKNIELQPIEKNASVVLKNIFFETNRYELTPTSLIELDKLVVLLSENPTIQHEAERGVSEKDRPQPKTSTPAERLKAKKTRSAAAAQRSQDMYKPRAGESD